MTNLLDLIKYIPLIKEAESFEKLVYEEKSDDSPIQIPYVLKSNLVLSFIDDFYSFVNDYQEIDLTNYDDILDHHGIKQNINTLNTSDLSKLNEQTVLVLILMAIRADRFSDGTLVYLFKNGSIQKCLERLKVIHESSEKEL